MSFSNLCSRKVVFWLVALLTILLSGKTIVAEGTPNLRSANGDPVLLFVGEEDFGDFASYNGPEKSRLNFRVGTPGEVVYFGMSRLYRNSGIPESFGQYKYRVRSAVDGSIVFGPITVNANNENLSTYEQAVIGPDVIGVGGYPTDENSTWVAPDAGEYFVEFEQTSSGRARYIGLWDITIVKDGVTQTGRVYSKNWAFRVPELNSVLPDCAFGAELSTLFYSYTADGFVTQIDFRNSGFQPLSFNLAFNRTGPGESGDLLQDRMSISEENATNNAAEHLIFLSEPDPILFPDGECGDVQIAGEIRCQAENTFCIPVESTLTGQVEIILDFNGNGVYDEQIDRLLLYAFDEERGFSACVPWDGLMGDGMRPEQGATVDILVEFTQGLQHWALYDGEFMRNGFCVTPIRPICGDGGDAALYWDDSNIPDEPGTDSPRKNLLGCDCSTPDCRTWTNFESFADDECTIINENTTGYGDRNTLNTWWFASSTSTASFDVPVEVAVLEGPKDHCPDELVVISLNYNSENTVSGISWAGPDGPITTSPGQTDITVSTSGLYTVGVTDEFGCESTAEFTLVDVSCMLNVNILSVECDNNGTETDPEDDVFFARVRVDGENSDGYRYNGVLREYGEEIMIGPFFIADGDVVFTAVDSEYDCCEESITITAPMPCSDGCAITVANIIGTECLDNGTPTDPSDDLFTFTMIIDGVNLGGNWINDRGNSGPYGEPLTFGPFPIAEGAQNYQFTDAEDENCVIFSTVQAPMPCSDECALIPKVENLLCSDSGTPFDPSDDTYTFDLSVEGINTPSVAYNVNGGGGFLYNQTNNFGPFPIEGDDFTYTLRDLGGTECTLTFTLEEHPTTCSDACDVNIVDARIVCDDFGTDDPADDALFVEILVTSQNPGARGWRTQDGQEGSFDEYYRVGTIAPGGETVTIEVADLDDASCSASRSVTSSAFEIICPEDVDETTHTVNLQSFRDSLTVGSDFIAGDQEICWLDSETFGSARRFTERYTLERTDTTPNLRLFSFYLYAPEGVELLGAVFSQMGVEQLDCCNLTNDGPVEAQPTNLRSLPLLPDSLRPGTFGLRQRFSVALRPNEQYSLVTSSPTPGVTGQYLWHIVSADGENLLIDRVNGLAPIQEVRSVPAIFDLLLSEVPDVNGNVASTDVYGAPTVDSLCSSTNFAFNDSLVSTCDRAQIFRSFDLSVADTTFEDACEQVLEFRALGLMDISWPEYQLQFGCADEYPALENGIPHPDYSGYPFLYREGIPVMLDTTVLENLRIAYEDSIEELPDGGRIVIRTWTVIDNCRLVSVTYDQIFKLGSNGLPFFTCPVNNHYCPIVEEDIMLWQVGSFDCVADVEIPQPELNNVCDTTDWTFITEVLAIRENGDTVLYTTLNLEDSRLLEDLVPGDYLMHFIGVHPEETIEGRYCRFRVADLTEPVAVCKSNVNLSVPGNGAIWVSIPVINQGSYDNCGVVLQELRRRLPEGHPEADSLGWSAWSESGVVFDCDDVGLNWTVQYRLWDAAGNSNFCTSNVVIRDNTNPYCTGLEEQFVTCDSLPDGFSAFDTTDLRRRFGMPIVIDNCSAYAIELEPIVTGDDCSPEHIRRRFNAIDQHGNLSTGVFYQDINITPSLAYAIRFPADLDTDCSDLTDTLSIIGTGCDSITVSYTDIPLPVQGEECRYFQRTFVVTNWCEWDGVSPAIQVGRDEDCDNTNGEVNVWLVRTNEGIFVDGDSLMTNAFPAENVRGALCGGENPEGYYREVQEINGGRYTYSQRVKIFDVTAPTLALTMLDTLCVDSSFCRIPVTVGIEVFDACQTEEGQVVIGVDFNNDGMVEATNLELGTFSGTFPNYTYTVTMPIGDHRFIFTVTDDCGNTSETSREFRVNDCYVPYLTCRGDRIYELSPVLEPGDIDGDGIVEEAAVLVEAVDLAQCNFGDCSGDLIFSVNRVGERPDRNQHTMFLDCEDRYSVELELYVWDEAFNPFSVQPDGTLGGNNWRMCVVTVYVQDPNEVCNDCSVDGLLTINGSVNTRGGAPMTNVSIFADGDAGQTVTDGSGEYALRGSVNGSYVLRADSDADPRAGLSTIDVLILRYHLLGILPITDPYVLLAADLDRDGEVTSADVVILQALVLGREEFYPEQSTWRFVPADWDGTGTPPDGITLSELQDCSFGHNFVGLKLGDLNNTLGADAGAGEGQISGVSRSRPVALSIAEQRISAGQTVTVTAQLAAGMEVIGGQAGFRWNNRALTLLNVSSEHLTDENLVTRGNQLHFNWREELPSAEVINLTFRVASSGLLSDFLALEDADNFRDEVYTGDLSTLPLYLNWTDAETANDSVTESIPAGDANVEAELLGIYPNPVVTTVRIGIKVEVDQRGKLQVYDAAGRMMLSASPLLTAGEQWVELDTRDWPAGMYNFRFQTKGELAKGSFVKYNNITK